MRLAAAGGPVVDLRRLQWDTAAAAALRQEVELQQRRGRWPEHLWGPREQWQQQLEEQLQQQEQSRGVGLDPCSYECVPAAAAAVVPGGWDWRPVAAAVLQAELVSVHAKAAAAAVDESSSSQGPASADGSEGDRPELLAALVEQLSGLVPDVQLLVLPVLLPSGR